MMFHLVETIFVDSLNFMPYQILCKSALKTLLFGQAFNVFRTLPCFNVLQSFTM